MRHYSNTRNDKKIPSRLTSERESLKKEEYLYNVPDQENIKDKLYYSFKILQELSLSIFHSPIVRRSLSKLTAIFTTGSPQRAKRSG